MDLDTVVFILAVVVTLVGIALAFFGRAIWSGLLSAIGGMIGWMIGFAVGIYFFGFGDLMSIIIVVIIAFVSSFILGAIFGFLVELALALAAALLAAGLFFYFNQGQIVVALVIFAVTFILAYVFIEKVVIVVTAFIGSILAAVGLWFLTESVLWTGVGLIGIFFLGCLIQYFMLDDYDTFLT